MPIDAPTAFFSYSREDSEFALRLAADLKTAGAGVWIDQLDIEPGQEWDNAIEDAVAQCPRMLLILTAASVKSGKVRNEIAFALDEGKTIIPVLYQDCMVPLQLRRIQHIDFRTDYARGLKALLRALGMEQPAAASAAAASAHAMEGQPFVSDAADRARLEEERNHALKEERRRTAEPDRLENERKEEERKAQEQREKKKAAEKVHGKWTPESLVRRATLTRLSALCVMFLLVGLGSEKLVTNIVGPRSYLFYYTYASIAGLITGTVYAVALFGRFPVARAQSWLFGASWALGWTVMAHSGSDPLAGVQGGVFVVLLVFVRHLR